MPFRLVPVVTAMLLLLVCSTRSEAQSDCINCNSNYSCSEECWDAVVGEVRTCGWTGQCTPDCAVACGSNSNCSWNCYDNGITNCQGYGVCDPNTCVPNWVETSRYQHNRAYAKNFGVVIEIWHDQNITEVDTACNQGQRDRCDTYLWGRCFFVSEASCCLGYGFPPAGDNGCYGGTMCS